MKVALVTGADGGVGKAVVARLAEAGWRVFAGVHSKQQGKADADLSDNARAVVRQSSLDLTDEGSIARFCADAIAHGGRIDALVNAAGAMNFVPLEDMRASTWTEALGVDLVGPALLSGEVLRSGTEGAVIVNIGSIHAERVEADAAGYAAAKAGLASLTRSIAVEGRRRRIRALCLYLGAVDTPMLHTNPHVTSGEEQVDPDQLGRPDDVAAVVLWALSDAASFVNGATLAVDGGRTARL